jgi:LPXTG-motif cell wall-anchored protein
VRLYLRAEERRPDPPPLRTNDRATILTGMVLWAVLGLGEILFRGQLAETGRTWWLWTSVIGLLLGGYGLLYISRRDRRRS